MNFFRDVISHLLKNAFEGHTKFSVADNTAVGDNPVRSISLDATPVNDEVIVSLSWDGGEKLFEKKLSEQEASHQFDLISTDLAEVSALTQKGEYKVAKDLMKKLGQKYSENTGDIVPTNLPKLHNTQASLDKKADYDYFCPKCKDQLETDMEVRIHDKSCDGKVELRSPEEQNQASEDMDSNLWKQAAQVKMQNVFPSGTIQNLTFDSTEDLKKYQDSMKASQPEKAVPLWEQEGKAPESKDELALPSMSYEDLEQEKEKEHENMQKHIDEKIKTELESALQEKAASVFGPAQVELVQVLRKNGRNWDEIKKILTKDFNFDKDATTIFVDEQRKQSGDEGIEIVKEEPKPESLTPPENLVSPETHEKLLKDLEDKKEKPVEEVKEIEKVEPIIEESAKKGICPECDGEGSVPAVRGGRVIAMDCPSCGGDKHLTHAPKELESSQEEIARADNSEIRKVAVNVPYIPSSVIQELKNDITNSIYRMNAPYSNKYRFSLDGDKIYRGEYTDGLDGFGPYKYMYDMETGEITENPNYKPTAFASLTRAKVASYMNISEEDAIEKQAADDLNPLQEPIQAEPTLTTQDVVPMEKSLDHNAPQKGDRVFVSSDLTSEKAGFEATYISNYKSKGTDFSIVETDEGDLLDIESHRVVKTSEDAGAQTAEPVMEPQIEKPKEADITVTPSTEKLTSASAQKCEVCEDLRQEKDPSSEYDPTCVGYLCPKHEKEYLDKKESSQDELLSIKVEAEALLKDVEGMGKTSYIFVKKGLEKHADDSAFEGNGWCRVWIQEDEIASDSRYPEILKQADESARIVGLKDLARDMAHEALRLADSAGAKVGVQSWFESLKPSDHDRIDWVALANPQVAESSLETKAESNDCPYCGKDKEMFSHEFCMPGSKGEKKANVMDTKCEECGEPLGPEAFLSKWPVCGKCTKKRHQKVTGSDFEKGISQNKTADEDKINLIMAYEDGQLDDTGILKLFSMLIKSGEAWSLQGHYGRTAKALIDSGYINENGTIIKDIVDTEEVPEQKLLSKQYAFKIEKQADEPKLDPKTKFKELERAPAYTDREKAIPASPELEQVLGKMNALQQNLATLDLAKQQIQAKMKEELSKLEQTSERVQMEAELQQSIDKAGVLIDALENKVVSWGDKLYTLKTQEVSYVPSLTPKEMLSKIYAKFEGAQKFVEAVLNGMKSQAENILEKTLVQFPAKKSSVVKEASIIDIWNDELLAALKELSSPL